MARPNSPPSLRPLTSLRFFAALHVVLFHAYPEFSGAALFQWHEAPLDILKCGFVGVGLFFILSGFILAYNYLGEDFDRRETRRDFWLARFARIYPVYAFGLLLAAPKFLAAILRGSEDPANSLPAAVAVGALAQAWVPEFALSWNGPGWSLSAEAFFYLLFPFFALAARRCERPAHLLGAAGLCWLIALAPPAIFHTVDPASPAWSAFVKFNPLLRLPEFVMGICLGRLFALQQREGRPPFRVAPALALTAVLLAAGLSLRPHIPKLLLHNGLFDPLFAVLILGLAWTAVRENAFTRVFSSRALVLLGESSYALYILHVPVKGWVMAGAERLPFIHLAGPWTSSMVLMIYLAAAILISIGTFRWIETPCRRRLRDWFRGGAGRHVSPETPEAPGLPGFSLKSVK